MFFALKPWQEAENMRKYMHWKIRKSRDKMEIQKIKAIIEAILFAAGRVVTQDELVLALEID